MNFRIHLISPSSRNPGNKGKAFHIPQMGLALLAALTPSDIDVSITDELVEPINFDNKVDLVGITVSTKTAVRAYEIADDFRSRGVPVVLGGIHPTAVPYEAIQHADAVVIGEAEGVWTQLLEDCGNGKLNKCYRSDKFPTLENLPLPRRELFQRDKYVSLNFLQTSRGCPFACHFCSVSTLYGSGVRLRPVDDVIREIETLEGNELLFIDDNIIGRPEYSKELFTRLIPLKKNWLALASVTIANNEETLKLLQKSGCCGLYIGFETNSVDSLMEAGKGQNVKNNYFETVKRLHDNGIPMIGSFVVGFDSEDKSCFERLLNFCVKSKIDAIDFSILVPYPGTVLYNKLKEENRLIDDHWWLKFEAEDVVYKPKLMTREELYEGLIWITREFYKIVPMLKRYVEGIGRRSLFDNFIFWKANMGFRKNANALLETLPQKEIIG